MKKVKKALRKLVPKILNLFIVFLMLLQPVGTPGMMVAYADDTVPAAAAETAIVEAVPASVSETPAETPAPVEAVAPVVASVPEVVKPAPVVEVVEPVIEPIVETPTIEGVITPEAASIEAVVADPIAEVVPVETVTITEEVSVAAPEWQVSADGKTADIGPVGLNTVYKAPQNSEVTVTFTTLPEIPGNLSIEEITLTDKQVAALGALSDKAYDITSDMADGTFEYALTLPKPADQKNVRIKYAENVAGLKDADTVASDDVKTENDSVSASLDHFTIFVVTTPTSVNTDCSGAGVGIVGTDTCYNSIQAAINAATAGGVIQISGTHGSASAYTRYDVPVTKTGITLQGMTGNFVYGTFVVQADGVTITGMNIQNKGDLTGESSFNRGGIYARVNSITITGNTITNGLGTSGGYVNGMQIMRASNVINTNAADYTITGNTISGNQTTTDPNWGSGGILVAQNSSSGTAGGAYYSILVNNNQIATQNTFNITTPDVVDYSLTNWQNTGLGIYEYAYVSNATALTNVIESARAGATILVAAGTYTENLTIDKSLSLIGVGDTTHIIGAVEATGANVTIQSLKITNSNVPGYGVKATAGKALTLNNVTVDVAHDGISMYDVSMTATTITINNSSIKGYAALYFYDPANSTNDTNADVTVNVNSTSLTGVANDDGSGDNDFAVIGTDYVDDVHVSFTGASIVANEYTVGAQAKEFLIWFYNAGNNSVTGSPTYTNGTNSKVNGNALFVSSTGYTNTVAGRDVARYVSDTTEFQAELASVATTPILVGRGDPAITTTAGTKTLNAGTTLIIEANNAPTTISAGTTLVNNGTIIIEPDATFINNGIIRGSGTISGIVGGTGITDITAPVLTITSPTLNQAINGRTVTIKGTVTDNDFNYYYCYVEDSHGEVGARDAACTTTWHAVTPASVLGSVTLPNDLPDGNYVVHLIGYDKTMNSAETTQSFVLDNTLPTGSANYTGGNKVSDIIYLKLIDDLNFNAAFTDNQALEHTSYAVWKADSNFENRVLFCGNWNHAITSFDISGTSASVSGGVKDCSPTGDWSNGSYVIMHIVYDAAGNTTYFNNYPGQKFVIDNTAPIINIDTFITNDTTPKLTGTVNDNFAAVSVSINGNTFTATNKGNGTWELTDGTITPSLSDGTYNVTASATDTAGNIGVDSSTNELTIDTIAPTATHKYYRNGAEVSGLVYAQNVNELTFDSTVTDNDPSSGLKYETFSIFEANGDGSFGWNTSYCGFRQPANTYALSGTADTITGNELTDCVSSLPEGGYYIMYGEYDNAARGNDTAVTQYRDVLGLHFVIDKSAPIGLGTPTADVSNPTNSTVINWIWTVANDTASGVKQYLWQLWNSTAIFLSGTANVAGVSTSGLTDETYTMKVAAEDNVGNQSGIVASATTTVDTTDPDVAITSPTDSIVKGSVQIIGTVTDINPHHYWLVIQNSSNATVAGPGTVNDATSFTDELLFTWNTALVPDGVYTIKLEARDAANNKDAGSATTKTVTVDNIAPVTTDSGTDANWYNIDVTVALNCDDGTGSGCDKTYYTTDGNDPTIASAQGNSVVVSSEGTTTVKYFSVDNAGNAEIAKTAEESVKIDKTEPESVITTFDLPNEGSITTDSWNGFIEGTASDTLSEEEISVSGVASVKLEITRTLSGSELTEYWHEGEEPGDGWQSEPATMNADGTDTWSYQLPGTIEEGIYNVSSHAVDNAGNVENTYSITIIYDKTIPEVTLAIDPVNPNGDNGWYDTKPVITLTPTDNYQVDRIEYQLDGTAGAWTVYNAPVTVENGEWQFYYRSIDTASNASDIGLKNVKVDTKDPDNVDNLDTTYKQSPNRVQLTWDVNDSDIDSVYIYRGKSKNFSVNTSSRIAKNPRNDTNYSDYDVTPGEKYYYKVVTVDKAGNKGDVKIISIALPTEGTAAVVTNEGTEVLPANTVLGAETGTEEQPTATEGPKGGTLQGDGQVLGEEASGPSDSGGAMPLWQWFLIVLALLGLGYYGYGVYRGRRNQTIR